MLKNKLEIENLVFEITRRCNMACAHCLRGAAQNMDIKLKYIDDVLDNVKSICSVTFSGGEPSLNIPAILYTLEACKKRNIYVGSFYIVTNGKGSVKTMKELVNACLEWYTYVDPNEDNSALCLSKDIFHEEIHDTNERMLRSVSFFREDKFTDFDNSTLIDEGRTLNNRLCDAGFDTKNAYCCDIDEDYWTMPAVMYVSANGTIKTGCDCAYNNNSHTVIDLSLESFEEGYNRWNPDCLCEI